MSSSDEENYYDMGFANHGANYGENYPAPSWCVPDLATHRPRSPALAASLQCPFVGSMETYGGVHPGRRRGTRRQAAPLCSTRGSVHPDFANHLAHALSCKHAPHLQTRAVPPRTSPVSPAPAISGEGPMGRAGGHEGPPRQQWGVSAWVWHLNDAARRWR